MTNHYHMIDAGEWTYLWVLLVSILNDDMCSSRVCQDGICVAVDQPLGSNCSKYDELCSSNACAEGICSDEKLKNNEACTSDSSCVSVSGACGYDSYNSSALKLL